MGGLNGVTLGVGETGGDGLQFTSLGEDGKPGHFDLDKEGEVDVEEDDAESESEELLECLLRDLVMVDDAELKSDRAGDVETDEAGEAARPGVCVCGVNDNGRTLTSFRTTIMER